MSQPTTGILLNSTFPGAPAGNQNVKPQSDGATPQQSISLYPQKATSSLPGVVVPDGTTITVDATGKISAASASPLTTKGDLFGHGTVDARIPVGSDGQVLTADSTQPLGVNYATPAAAITALTGDVTASGPGSAAATLAASGVTAGSYTNAVQYRTGRSS